MPTFLARTLNSSSIIKNTVKKFSLFHNHGSDLDMEIKLENSLAPKIFYPYLNIVAVEWENNLCNENILMLPHHLSVLNIRRWPYKFHICINYAIMQNLERMRESNKFLTESIECKEKLLINLNSRVCSQKKR